MSYGGRRHGYARYGRVPKRLFFKTYTESVVLNGSVLRQANYQESFYLSDNSFSSIGKNPSESIYLSDSFSRTADFVRVYPEEVYLSDLASTQSGLSRVYSEEVFLSDTNFKTVRPFVSEELFLEEDSERALSVFKDEDIYVDDFVSKDVSKFVDGEFYLSDSYLPTIKKNVFETVFLDEVDLSRGDNFIKIIIRNLPEQIFLNDDTYRLSVFRVAGVPEILSDQLERYNLGLDQLERYGLEGDAEEPDIRAEATSDNEDSSDL